MAVLEVVVAASAAVALVAVATVGREEVRAAVSVQSLVDKAVD